MMTTTFVHVADVHIDTAIHSRINPRTGLRIAMESNAAVLREAVDYAVKVEADLFLLSGDLVSHGKPLPETYMLLSSTLSPLVEAGIPIEITEGNHERLAVSATQRTAASVLGTMLSQGAQRASHAGTEIMLTDFDKVQVLSVPYPSKSRILSRLKEQGATIEDGDDLVIKDVLSTINDILTSAERDESVPLILSGHFTATSNGGMPEVGSERALMSHFNEVVLPLDPLLDYNPAYVALGHIHTPQKLTDRAYYCGSPNKLTFTDAHDTKGFNVITVGDDGELDVTIVPTTTRHMGIIDLENGDEPDLTLMRMDDAYQVRLGEGETAIPRHIVKAARNVGAVLVPRLKPPAKDKRERTVLPETITPAQALKTWLDEEGIEGKELNSVLKRFDGLSIDV